MTRLLFISLAAILLFGCGDHSAEIEKLQESNDALQKKNDSLSNALNEVKDEFDELIFSQEKGIDSPGSEYMPYKYRSQANNEYINVEEDAKNEFDKNLKEQLDLRTAPSKTIPFEEQASNPFGGSGSEFGGGSMGDGNAVGGSGGVGDGPGRLVRTNAPRPPTQDLDVGGNICIELTVNDNGKVLFAKSIESCTKVTDKNVIKNVVDYVKKNIKFKAQAGAPIRKHTYTVYIQAG